MYKIIIDRFNGYDNVKICHWENLISSLVLCGYEVYGDDDKIIFKLGWDDKIEEIEE